MERKQPKGSVDNVYICGFLFKISQNSLILYEVLKKKKKKKSFKTEIKAPSNMFKLSTKLILFTIKETASRTN